MRCLHGAAPLQRKGGRQRAYIGWRKDLKKLVAAAVPSSSSAAAVAVAAGA